MTAFQKAEALATQRYDRDKLLAVVDEVTTHFRMPNSFERSKMRAVCRYLADALDRCSGSTLQQRWNDFEKRFWPKWKAGVDRRGREYWTWGARVLISARMVVPSLDMLSDLRVNQWIAHLPEDHPLAQQHTLLLQRDRFDHMDFGSQPPVWQFQVDCGFYSYAVTTASAI